MLRRQLDAELRAVLGSAPGSQAGSSTSGSSGGSSSAPASSGSSAAQPTLLGRWFGGARRQATQPGPSSAGSCRPSLESIRAGQHPVLRHAAEEVGRLIKQYNNAVLADKEALGSHWPLDRSKPLDWEAEVDAALAAIRGSRGRSSS